GGVMLILGFLKRSQLINWINHRDLNFGRFAQGDQELGFCRMMDRVGHLPDDLLLKILSYLSTIEVLITSYYGRNYDYKKYGSFSHFVSASLLLHKAPVLEILQMSLDGTCSEEEIVSCLEIASNRNLREPKMEADVKISETNLQKLLPGSLTCVKRLSLCVISPQRQVPQKPTEIFHQLLHLSLCTCYRDWRSYLTWMIEASPKLQTLKLQLFQHHV
ncbi:hypothetical protein HID58_042159, partial [Brassica napus]